MHKLLKGLLILLSFGLILSCASQKSIPGEIRLESGVTGQGIRFLSFSYVDQRENLEQVERISLNEIDIPFSLTLDGGYEALEVFLLLEEKPDVVGQEEKVPSEAYGDFLGKEELDLCLFFKDGSKICSLEKVSGAEI